MVDGLWRMVREAVVSCLPQAVTGLGGQQIAAGFKDRNQVSLTKSKAYPYHLRGGE